MIGNKQGLEGITIITLQTMVLVDTATQHKINEAAWYKQ